MPIGAPFAEKIFWGRLMIYSASKVLKFFERGFWAKWKNGGERLLVFHKSRTWQLFVKDKTNIGLFLQMNLKGDLHDYKDKLSKILLHGLTILCLMAITAVLAMLLIKDFWHLVLVCATSSSTAAAGSCSSAV